MTGYVAGLLDKARRQLADGETMRAAGLAEATGRAAYLAAFTAARALILARTDKVVKTHRGVRAEFARLLREEPALDPALSSFLAQAYGLKTIADYDATPGAVVAAETAAAALATAHRFVAAIAAILPETP